MGVRDAPGYQIIAVKDDPMKARRGSQGLDRMTAEQETKQKTHDVLAMDECVLIGGERKKEVKEQRE